jgi:hypothetical protein
MEPNTHSNQGPDRLAALTAAMDDMDADAATTSVRIARALFPDP